MVDEESADEQMDDENNVPPPIESIVSFIGFVIFTKFCNSSTK